jgi:hypothetical protein
VTPRQQAAAIRNRTLIAPPEMMFRRPEAPVLARPRGSGWFHVG